MFKKTSKREFEKLLRERKHESLDTIEEIESILKRKRGYVLKMPPRGSSVILLISGGLDSTVVWNILMEKHKLNVYPVHLLTGQPRNRYETEAAKFYSHLFKNRYPKHYRDLFSVTHNTTPPEIRRITRGKLINHLHPQVIIDNLDPESNQVILQRKYTFPAFMSFPASSVAQFYELNKAEKIRTIFLSCVSSDAEYNESQTLTATRATMLALCAFTNEYDWQVINYPYEKELGHNLFKSDLIRWAYKQNLPLNKTYSCFRGKRNNCGECLACRERIKGFKQARVQDTTVYRSYSLYAAYTKRLRNFLRTSSAYPVYKNLKYLVQKKLTRRKQETVKPMCPTVRIKDYF